MGKKKEPLTAKWGPNLATGQIIVSPKKKTPKAKKPKEEV